MSRLVLLLLSVVGTAALAQGEAAEQATVREKLAMQRATLALIESRRVSALEALELVQQRAMTSAQRVKMLERDVALFRKRLEAAEHEDEVTRRVLQQYVRRLSPRLWGLYRLTRRRPLEVLLSAKDFSSMVWRSRALQATVEEDLRLLRTVQRVAALRHQAETELRRLQGSLNVRLGYVREQAALARTQQEVLEEVVGTINGEAELARRMVRELEQADSELGKLIRELNETPDTTGFGRSGAGCPTGGGCHRGGVWQGGESALQHRHRAEGRGPARGGGHAGEGGGGGTVAYAGWLRGYGNLLIVDHGGGYHSLMAHLSTLTPAVGATVAAGEVVGAVGDTGSLKGAYLYFEIRRGGQAVDPALWLVPARR
jgi:septal ring factor EnvC (AmiA/AmiB activator)